MQIVDEIDAMIEAWTEKRSKHEVMEILAGAGVPCGAVLDSTEVLGDPHLRQTPLRHRSRAPAPRPLPDAGQPGAPSESPTDVTRSPMLGEHNAEVYRRLLGYTPDQLDQLKRDGVI